MRNGEPRCTAVLKGDSSVLHSDSHIEHIGIGISTDLGLLGFLWLPAWLPARVRARFRVMSPVRACQTYRYLS